METSPDTCGQRTVQALLLLCLLVVKAAAGCLKPSGRENIVLSTKALLLNDYPERVEVTLECANGYERESGSGNIACINEKWTEPDLICKKKDCGPPETQPNMRFNISAGTLFGALIKATCDEGYKLTGSAYKQCFPAGWSGRAKCIIVTCPKPPEVTNGRISWDAQNLPKYGEIIQYTCDEGYTLIGESSIVCSATGKYNSQPPECKGVTKEDRSTPASPAQEASTSADASVTPTASTTAAVSPSVRGGLNILTAVNTTTSVTSSTSSSVPGSYDEIEDVNKDSGNVPVIISVIAVSLVVSIFVFFIHKFLLRRKGFANGTAPIC
ncbi:complement decay-accelerating factor isoform X2 [Acanthochromis polyacanthus]|uniref:complement decay-accelerating factor isoform X2 n=1 Tax=Acanthochromis polyacanthus TaxID=80966 RepID=UPI002234B74D|nr:complement decay-accelerating factor isoform X2 [Acanthochromis polyacanthus]